MSLKDADEVRIVLDQTFEKPEVETTKERLVEHSASEDGSGILDYLKVSPSGNSR